MRLYCFSTLLLAATLSIVIITPRVASAQDFSEAARVSDFATFVTDFENSYAYLNRPDKPWLTWQTRYGPAVQQAETKAAFDTVLASALSELHDFHAEVRSPVPDRWLPVPTFTDMWAEYQGNQAVIIAVRRGSDAERAGIVAGDRVIEVGNLPLDQAIAARLTPAGRSAPGAPTA